MNTPTNGKLNFGYITSGEETYSNATNSQEAKGKENVWKDREKERFAKEKSTIPVFGTFPCTTAACRHNPRCSAFGVCLCRIHADYQRQDLCQLHPTTQPDVANILNRSEMMKPHFSYHNQYLLNLKSDESSKKLPLSPSVIAIMGGEDSDSDKSNSEALKYEWPEGVLLMVKKVFRVLVKYALAYPLVVFFIWALLYIFWGADLALPGGPLFALIILEITALCLGHFSTLLTLAPMTGMLCAGLILRNVPYINVAKDLTPATSSPLRAISVVILLTRGAFGVDFNKIKTYKKVVPGLAIGSCIIEAICAGTAAYFIIGFSMMWASLFGCIMSAMSGAGALPYLCCIDAKIDPHAKTSKAKETILVAKTACGLDAILAICMAECVFGFIFGDGILEAGLCKGLAEVALGGAFGICWGGATGFVLIFADNPIWKTITIFSGGVMSLLGLTKIGYPRGGPLGVFLGSLIAVNIWKWRGINLTHLTKAYEALWFIFQPLLFGIIGSRIDLGIIDWGIIYKGVACLGISLGGRMIGCFLLTSWSGLSLRERLFLVITWCGKGTVQAALGPVALDTAIELGLDQELATHIMNLAAMSILISSILGYLSLNIFGPRILSIK